MIRRPPGSRTSLRRACEQSAAGAGVVLVCAAAALSGGVASASSPGSSTLAATAGAGVVRANWTGTVPAGTNPLSTCSGPGTGGIDPHSLTVRVPAGGGASRSLNVTVRWTPVVSATTSDEILTILGPDGKEISSSDTGNPQESVTVAGVQAGTYTALVCGSTNAQPQDYTGVATLTTTLAAGGTATLPLTPSGLGFSASVPSDLQRDEGEPAVTVDQKGRVYTCGPSGFSNIADYAQVSTDGGSTFHLLGQPPRGQISPGEGGGDCALATSPVRNSAGDYTLAYSGLGPLTSFSSATSPDGGVHITGSPISESVPGVDRQWLAFADANTVFLNYNSQALHQTVQKSTDGGLTYDTPGTVAATDGGRIGQIRVMRPGGLDLAHSIVYFPYSAGTKVKLAMSFDEGKTFSQCVAVDAGISPTAGFPSAANDTAGNLYVAYTEKGGDRATYMVTLPASKVASCKGGSTNPGFSPKTRMNRGNAATSVMSWIAAGGAPGRVAVAYYGTPTVGDPDSGSIKASWNVYVSQSIDALSGHPHVSQTKVTTHPFHYDSICLGGLGCDLSQPAGDRSLVDYFTMEYNPATKRLVLVFSQTGKRPGDAAGYISTPEVAVQASGPSNGGGALTPERPLVRTSTSDPAGDAISNYSSLTGPGIPATNTLLPRHSLDAMDFVGTHATEVLPERNPLTGVGVANGGFNIRMHLRSLGDASLQDALTSQQSGSLIWLWRFVGGYQASGVTARYDLAGGFSFGYNDYTVGTTNCPPNTGKCLTYPATTPLRGKVNQDAGTIEIEVPRSLLKQLSGPEGPNLRPLESGAVAGSMMHDATAVSLANTAPSPDVQTYMYPLDQTAASDFAIPGAAPTKARPGAHKTPTPRPGAPVPGSKLAFTGANELLGGLGLALLGTALLSRRLRRAG